MARSKRASLIELMDSGDFVFHCDDEGNNAKIDYTDRFAEWFVEDTGKVLNQENLSIWFNDLLRNSLNYYDKVQKR